MGNLFDDYLIDIESPAVYKKLFKKKDGKGYHYSTIHDKYGNVYHSQHEVIMAEGLQLPKHKWPKDEFGRRYQVDHIVPVSNGGTDEFSNLRLVPMVDNLTKNELTMENKANRKFKRGRVLAVLDENGNIVKKYRNKRELEADGFNFNTVRRSVYRGYKTSGGLRFEYI